MHSLAYHQNVVNGSNGSMMQTLKDIPDIKPEHCINLSIKWKEKKLWAAVYGTNKKFTSIDVATFLSLIFSYFCFLVPAFKPCHGRLKPEDKGSD